MVHPVLLIGSFSKALEISSFATMAVNTSLFYEASGLMRNETEDFFEDVFAEPVMNWVMISLYIMGIPATFGIGIVAWMERTGLVGPYRSLLNQLVGFGLETVSTLGVPTFNKRLPDLAG